MAEGHEHARATDGSRVEMPAPTAWPLLAAAGAAFGCAGLVTNGIVSLTGAVLFVAAAVGWFREVLPHEHHEEIERSPIALRARAIAPVPEKVQHLRVGAAKHRMRVPVEIHPYSSGVRGGIIGGIVMALLAMVFGLVSHKSPWYPVNLLAAAALPSLADASTEKLASFQAVPFVLASLVHGATSLIVGLIYGVMLPMVPRYPILAGGLVGPILWTGIVWATLGIVNPTLNARIEWTWFIASQIGFGLAAGSVVARTEKIATMQALPFTTRAGIETGAIDEGRGRDR